MFRFRRSALLKRLWKNRIPDRNDANESTAETTRIGKTATSSTAQEAPLLAVNNATSCSEDDVGGARTKAAAHALLKRLKERHLEALVRAVESRGGEKTDCVLLPKEKLRLGQRGLVSPHVLCCQTWRWSELGSAAPGAGDELLKRLPCCQSPPDDPMYVCCNPYHWSLRVPESPQPLYYKATATERVLMKEDKFEEETLVSLETGGTPTPLRLLEGGSSSNLNRRKFWCHIAYWEHRQRVGRLFTVFEPSVDVFQELPHGDGMCLAILQTPSDTEVVRRTRDKIGFGVTLSHENDGLWMYNRSSYPVFVNSPTFDPLHSCAPSVIVKKVAPGYSVRIFDFEVAELTRKGGCSLPPALLDGPYDPNSIRISFAKGWGPNYSRQFITSCPCWIEVLLAGNR